MKQPLGALLAGGIPIGVGTALSAYAISTGLLAQRARRWPGTIGTILSSEVAEVETPHRLSKQYRPVLTYAYEVDSVPYRSERIGFGLGGLMGDGLFRSRREAEKVASRYKAGDSVEVVYDPKDSSRAVLRTGINKGQIANLLAGLFFIALGTCAAIALWHN